MADRSTSTARATCPRSRLDQDIERARATFALSPADAAHRRFIEIEATLEREEAPLRRQLLETELDWTDDDRHVATWLRDKHAELASLADLVQRAFATQAAAGDEACDLAARSLAHAGEAAKCGLGAAGGEPFDFRRAHALMRTALASHRERTAVTLRYEGRAMPCTIEGLYWRALLLARFSGGPLTRKQVEVLDAWLWEWMPALLCGPDALAGSPLRADLDGGEGLKRGLRLDRGPALYLAQAPLDAAHAALLAQFHAGLMVPSFGSASTFRIENHVAVLDVIRREWRASKRALVSRAARHPSGRPGELLVGLPEVMRRGFLAPPPDIPALTLADADSRPTTRPPAWSIDSIYEPHRRHVRLLDESEIGWGLEGSAKDCDAVSAGDLVALRLGSDEPLAVGRVVRSSPSRAAGRIVLGVHKVADTVRSVAMTRGNGEALPLLFVPGQEASGRHDAYLVSDGTYQQREPLRAVLDGATFTIRFNRIRERGRGWVLAGFEVIAAETTASAA